MISQNIQTLRLRHAMTQEQLAEHLGVARQTVAKWESGESLPDLTNARALSALFDVSLDDLVSHDDGATGYPVPPAGLHIFGVVRVGERGQIVIPKKAREVFNLTPGSELLVLGDESQGIALQSVENVLSSFEPFIGAIKAAQKRISPEEDNQSL